MTCPACLHEWPLLPAHVIRTRPTTEGCREIIKCPNPKCGHEFEAQRPDPGECEGD